MRLYAALLFLSFLMAAPAQAQYNLSVTEMMDLRGSGVPILDPKLELLIADVDRANFMAVDFHNEKFCPEVNKYLPSIGETWMLQHDSLVARWTAWDKGYQWWFTKKKVEASSSVAAPGGAIKVRNMETAEVQSLTLLRWRSVFLMVGYLNENKGAIEDLGDLGKLWSHLVDRIRKLDKATRALARY